MRRPLDRMPRPLVLAGRPLPIVGTARIYSCGITPYDVTHLGHAATFVWVDAAVRVLRWLGAEVELCRNVTNVDDVLTAAAEQAGAPYDSFAAIQQYAFDRDMTALRVLRPDHEPRADAYVRQVIELVAALLESDHAYERGGTVYFRGAEVTATAAASGSEVDQLLREYGEEPGDPAKDHPHDVPVWRAAESGHRHPAWPSPWGDGRPGWHAECTAMALSLLGSSLDLHAGGADLAFPHHAYETAHAEAASGVRPFSRAWLHVGVVRVDGVKMAKSIGNLVLVGDLLGKASPAAIRLAVLDRPYAQSWDWSSAVLDAAQDRLERLYSAAGRSASSDSAADAIREALRHDLGVSQALNLAEETGGSPARNVLNVLGLD